MTKDSYFFKRLVAYTIAIENSGTDSLFNVRFLGLDAPSFRIDASNNSYRQLDTEMFHTSVWSEVRSLAKKIHTDYLSSIKHIPKKKNLEL